MVLAFYDSSITGTKPAGSQRLILMPYEIDPAIVRIAHDPFLFSFLRVRRPDAPIILGDARLTLANAPDGASQQAQIEYRER